MGVQNTRGKGSRQFVQCPNMIIFLLTMVIPVQPLQIPPPKCNPPSLTQPQSPKAGLTKIFFFRYLIWNVLWKCVNFHCMNLRQKQHFFLSLFFHFRCNSILLTCLCGGRFFPDINFCSWQKFFCDQNFFLWQKCVSLKQTWTEISFCNINWFS